MQSAPLTISHIFHRAEQQFARKGIVSIEGGIDRRMTVTDWAVRVRRLATALGTLGLPSRATVATFAWNSSQHLELYYAVPCSNRVLHPLNIRLSPEQLIHVIQEAEDEIIFIDRSLLARLWPQAERLPQLRYWVIIDDGGDAEIPDNPRVIRYEELLASAEPFDGYFEIADENLAASICHTSGTTGKPKGVVYSHRSTVLHSLSTMAAGAIGIAESDVVLPIVPMFHGNAWGLPFTAVFAGAELVLPGSDLTAPALLGAIARHAVTVTAAVPVIWSEMLPHLGAHDTTSLRLVLGGGSATPLPLAQEWERSVGVPIRHTWGMTELNPTGAIGGLRSYHAQLTPEEREIVLASQGQAAPLMELRIVDIEDGTVLPNDGSSQGELQARGPFAAAEYLSEDGDLLTSDGWLHTGDIASIDSTGYMVIRDRLKDLIKSGGEWIPTVQLEYAITENERVAEAAVVAREDPKWLERPVAFVVLRSGAREGTAEILEDLSSRVPKWWLPDEVFVVDVLPRNTTGKVAKDVLRKIVAERT